MWKALFIFVKVIIYQLIGVIYRLGLRSWYFGNLRSHF